TVRLRVLTAWQSRSSATLWTSDRPTGEPTLRLYSLPPTRQSGRPPSRPHLSYSTDGILVQSLTYPYRPPTLSTSQLPEYYSRTSTRTYKTLRHSLLKHNDARPNNTT